MITIEAVYDLATPGFIGGAGQRQAELRVPSFKGALRFWWRAVQGLHVRDAKILREREAYIFGSASGGRSRLSIALDQSRNVGRQRDPVTSTKVLALSSAVGPGRPPSAHGARYLGYGVMDFEGKLSRPYLQTPLSMGLRMSLRMPGAAQDVAGAGSNTRAAPAAIGAGVPDEAAALSEIVRALQALGTLGSLGSKARKGYGSLVLRTLTVDGKACWSAPQTPEQLGEAIAALYRSGDASANASGPEPEWTALSAHARHLILVPAVRAGGPRPSGFDMLDRVGRELVRFRSYGKEGKILGNEDAERNFRGDHDLSKSRRPDRHPERVAFGLPHNYSKPFNHSKPFKVEPAAGVRIDRRASPLFIHVHQCGDLPVAVLSFLPARFLPPGARLRVGPSTVDLAGPESLWKPVHAFFERLKDPQRHGKAGIARVLEVKRP